MVLPDLSALDGLTVAGYPLATLLIWGAIAGTVCLILGVVVRVIFETSILLYLGAGILLTVGGTYLVNAL